MWGGEVGGGVFDDVGFGWSGGGVCWFFGYFNDGGFGDDWVGGDDVEFGGGGGIDWDGGVGEGEGLGGEGGGGGFDRGGGVVGVVGDGWVVLCDGDGLCLGEGWGFGGGDVFFGGDYYGEVGG